ncbi:hypothetical protein SNEBB_004352 [Seison nebaliae]|nr:hypothetical protein SNEBB_004352 [Seison nebaliae]
MYQCKKIPCECDKSPTVEEYEILKPYTRDHNSVKHQSIMKLISRKSVIPRNKYPMSTPMDKIVKDYTNCPQSKMNTDMTALIYCNSRQSKKLPRHDEYYDLMKRLNERKNNIMGCHCSQVARCYSYKDYLDDLQKYPMVCERRDIAHYDNCHEKIEWDREYCLCNRESYHYPMQALAPDHDIICEEVAINNEPNRLDSIVTTRSLFHTLPVECCTSSNGLGLKNKFRVVKPICHVIY